jgi:alpha-1,2-glucosyltransferase
MAYPIFSVACILVLKQLNSIVDEPYMDEPFHVPQTQAYCRGEWSTWDPKLTTPPGLYFLTLVLKRIFMFKCTLPMLRLTPLLSLLVLPLVLTRLILINKRIRPTESMFVASPEAIVVACFPIAWFFGFLYYTEVPSLVAVLWMVLAARQGKHWEAALAGALSCTFRQTNVVWALYAYAISQLTYLRYERKTDEQTKVARLHDPIAEEASFSDLLYSIASFPRVVPRLLPQFIPYSIVLALFGAFVAWNGGIVLGDKSNHIPTLHIPQFYYFVGFTTILGWPVLLSAPGGFVNLLRGASKRMFGSAERIVITTLATIIMCLTVHLFTIHHPFLLADNRHYTFYVWRRVFMAHPAVPYLLVPGYIACSWLWFLRLSRTHTLLQFLALPIFILPTLLPTPLLEPRYFLIPYILLRAQVVDVPAWGMALEGVWYLLINSVTMWVFLYKEREGVGRFMW